MGASWACVPGRVLGPSGLLPPCLPTPGKGSKAPPQQPLGQAIPALALQGPRHSSPALENTGYFENQQPHLRARGRALFRLVMGLKQPLWPALCRREYPLGWPGGPSLTPIQARLMRLSACFRSQLSPPSLRPLPWVGGSFSGPFQLNEVGGGSPCVVETGFDSLDHLG